MATAFQTHLTRNSPWTWPTLESVEQAVRTARRTVNDARAATEDFAAGASLEVRRHPLSAVGIAAAAGLAAGCAFGLTAAWFWRRRS